MKKITFLFVMFLAVWQIQAQSIVIGAETGTTTSFDSDPIDGFYNSFRYQVVYTAAELSATLTPYDEITALGFSIEGDYGGGNLLGYTIKMGHTNAVNAATHNTAPTSIVKNAFNYDPSVTAVGTYDMIIFDTPFIWNGTDNILIDICSDGQNPFTGPYGQVRMATMTNGSRFFRADGAPSCAVNTSTTNGNRPSIQFNYTDGTPPACLPPSALMATSVTATAANFGWTASTSTPADGYDIYYSTSNSAPTAATIPIVENNVGTSYNLMSLTPQTTYYWWVRSDCSAGVTSTWGMGGSFTTGCLAFAVPFTEGFNSASTTEACWTVLNVNGDADSWNTNYATSPFEGDQSAMMYTDGNSGANDDWLISPAITLTGNQRLKFHYRVQSAGEPNDFQLLLSTTGKAPADFTNTLVASASYSNITYVEQIVYLTAYSGDVHIAWHVPSGGLDGWRLYIDNVIIEDVPTCIAPSTLAVSNISNNTVDLSWVDPSTSQTNFQYAIQVPGTGIPAGAGIATTGTSVAGATLDVSGNPLTSSTSYEVYVRADCGGGDFSVWTGPINFATACDTFIAPFNEPFATNVLPNCWTQGGATPWEYGSISGTTPSGFADYGANSISDHTGLGGTFIGMDGSDNTDGEVSTLTTPFIDVTALTTPRLKYAVFVNNTNDAARNTLDVEVYDGAAWNIVNSVTDNLGANWVEFVTDLSTLTITGPIQIRFTVTGVSNGGFNFYSDILIDDVIVENTPACAEPTGLLVSNLTDVSADISWTATTGSYEYVLDMVATNPAGSGAIYSSENYSALGLTPSTTYYFHVRTVCAGSTYSAWSTILFTTPATPPANDNCAAAIALTPGGVFADNPITGTNVAATNSNETAPGCASFQGGDVWYSAIVPASGSLTFEVNGATGGLTDTGGAVYSGACGSLVLISCNDSSSSAGDHPLITVSNQTPGAVLYFSVWEYGNNAFGTFQVSAYDATLSADSFDSSSFVAYPNPVKDVLNLSYSSEISSVKVINLLGQEVISRKVNNTTSQIDMSSLTAGAYIVNITFGDVVETIKVIKQ